MHWACRWGGGWLSLRDMQWPKKWERLAGKVWKS